MTSCKHHFHITSVTRQMDGSKIENKVCCHCGIYETKMYPPPPPVNYTYNRKRTECGPYRPDDPTPMWGDEEIETSLKEKIEKIYKDMHEKYGDVFKKLGKL